MGAVRTVPLASGGRSHATQASRRCAAHHVTGWSASSNRSPDEGALLLADRGRDDGGARSPSGGGAPTTVGSWRRRPVRPRSTERRVPGSANSGSTTASESIDSFVPDEAGVGRGADRSSLVVVDRVVLPRRIRCTRQLEVERPGARRAIMYDSTTAATSAGSHTSVTFWRWSSPADLLERLSPDEVMVELDHVAVAELLRPEVVVLDVGCIEAAADRPRHLFAGRRQPLTEGTERFAGEDGRHRPRDPAQLECVGEVGERPDPAQVVSRLRPSGSPP